MISSNHPFNRQSPDRQIVNASGLILTGIVLLALALRLIGIRFGLPAVYNPDEIAIMARALGFAKGDLNPHNFVYPTFFFYALFGWIGLYFFVARLIGAVPSLHAFQTQFFVDPSDIYLAGRLLGVACGTLTVVAVYVLGRRLFDRITGLLAALFLAVAPFHVRDSHYVKHDVPVTLLIVLAYIAIVRMLPRLSRPGLERARADEREPRASRQSVPRDLAIASVACGTAFSTHYYSVFLALPLTLAVFYRFMPEGWPAVARKFIGAALISVVTFFALSPFLLAEPRIAMRDIAANRQIVVDRASHGPSSAARYRQMLVNEAIGWPIALLAAGGTIWLVCRSPAIAALLLAFPLPFLVFVARTVPASRYLNPVLPFMALLGAFMTTSLSVAATRRLALAGALGAAAILPPLVDSIRGDLFIRQEDTRTIAERFIESRAPAGTSILLQPYSVPLRRSKESLREALRANLGTLDSVPMKFSIELAIEPSPAPAYRLFFLGDGGRDADKIYVHYEDLGGTRGLAPLRRLGVQIVILKRYNGAPPLAQPFLDALAGDATRIAVFSPYRANLAGDRTAAVAPYLHNTDARIDPALERPGPAIEIWRLLATK